MGKGTILFLHGWGLSGAVWLQFFDSSLRKEYNLVSVDLPGFGKSGLPNRDFSVHDYAGVIKDFLIKLQMKNVTIIGHSFGGSIAAILASSHPELIRQLVLVSSAGIRQKYKSTKLIELLVPFLRPVFEVRLMSKLRRQFYQWIGSDYLFSEDLKGTFRKVVSEDITPYLSRIFQPTLIIWGRHDEVTPISRAEIFRRDITNSQLKIMEQSGHFPYQDASAEFISQLENFLYGS